MLLHSPCCTTTHAGGPNAQKTLNLEVGAETSMSASSPSLSAALGPQLGAHGAWGQLSRASFLERPSLPQHWPWCQQAQQEAAHKAITGVLTATLRHRKKADEKLGGFGC